MKRFLLLAQIAIIMISTGFYAPAFSAADEQQYIVQFSDLNALNKTEVLNSVLGDNYKKIHLINGVVFKGSANAVLALSKKFVIRQFEIDQIVTMSDQPGILGKPSGGGVQPAQVMDWGVAAIEANQVWSAYEGAGVNVAVIDTGIDLQHSDLKVIGGATFVPRTTGYDDDNGHGSHVAGIIAARNNAIGIVGVAPKAELYAVKVLDKRGSGYVSNVILGIEWAIDHNMDVINMSLGSNTGSQFLYDALESAKIKGILSIAAAGNDSGPVDFPGAYNNTVAVGATDSLNTIAWFSSFGPEIDVVAPGVNIYSASKANDYKTLSGTSMATPHVAGLAVLYKDKYPNATLDDFLQALAGSSLDLGDAGFDVHYGHGLVNAVRLMQ